MTLKLRGEPMRRRIPGVSDILKRIAAALLPRSIHQELKRLLCRWQIWRGTFTTGEPEFGLLDRWVAKGDCVIDVGANVGHYTVRLASLVGDKGRVIAFEPIPWSFELLASNVALLRTSNVTLINAALSEKTTLATMTVPKFRNGLDNFYEAKLDTSDGDVPVLCLSMDGLGIDRRIKLVKIDAEGHEAFVLQGMRRLIERDKPVLIVEGISPEVDRLLIPLGYQSRVISGSPNKIFHM